MKNGDRCVFSNSIMKLIKEIDEDKFGDMVFLLLSLLDDYIYETDKINELQISSNKNKMNPILKNMINEIFYIKNEKVFEKIIEELKTCIRLHGYVHLQRGYITISNKEIYIKQKGEKNGLSNRNRTNNNTFKIIY